MFVWFLRSRALFFAVVSAVAALVQGLLFLRTQVIQLNKATHGVKLFLPNNDKANYRICTQ